MDGTAKLYHKKLVRVFSVIIAAVIALAALAACNENHATSAASCAVVRGDGQNGNDANVHRFLYPGQKTDVQDGENIQYFPCNDRNYIIIDGQLMATKNLNGDSTADRITPILAWTQTGNPIRVSVKALWTLNQDPKALAHFWKVCIKYSCSSPDDVGGSAHSSTVGWNNMLSENFSPAFDFIGQQAAGQMDDQIWETHSTDLYNKMADLMSQYFPAEMLKYFGGPEKLFCGSGSGWQDPNNPGHGTFNCTDVRIEVSSVTYDADPQRQPAGGNQIINKQRHDNAVALYGPEYAGQALAMQDAIDKCKADGVTCVFNLGGFNGGSSTSVPIPAVKTPVTNATVVPTQTPNS